MKKIILTIALVTGLIASAQVKIGDNVDTMNASSILELESTTKGVLFPRVALTSTTAFAPLAAHVAGMTVYNTATAGDVTPGMYTNSGTAWVKLTGGAGGGTAFQNIGGGVQTLLAPGTIADSTYIVFYNGVAGTLSTPTVSPAGKTFWVRNLGVAAVQVAGNAVNSGKGRCFISDGSAWQLMTP